MKTVGIIGGLGPETTAKFYLQLINSCYEVNKKSRPPVLIWSVPLNYEIENDLIIHGQGEEKCLPYLKEAAKRLEEGGADFLVVPCNSVHIFIEEIRQAVKIPVLSIIEETAHFLKTNGIKKIGLLATIVTVNKRLYQKALEETQIEVILPDERDQKVIGQLISALVLNQYTTKEKEELNRIIDNLETKQAENVVLACTDLQLLAPSHPKLKIYDSMEILLRATVHELIRE